MSEKIAGVSASIAFMLVMMIGIFYQQPGDEIVMKSLVALVLFYILGFIFGEAGTMVVLESMERFDLNRWLDTEGKEMGIHVEGDKLVLDEVEEPNGDEEKVETPEPAVTAGASI